jgi:cell wall assembly regulator SMI1
LVEPDDIARRWGNLVLWGPFTSVRETDFDRVERVVGVALPPGYRRFMKVAHGGTLQYAVRLPPDDSTGQVIEFSSLYDVVGDGSDTLIGELRAHPSTFMAEALPAPLLPVARDGGGSQLYLDVRSESHGTVWAFMHGLPHWAGGDGQDRGGVVAASWDDYLRMLFIDEEMARGTWEDAVDGAEDDWLQSVIDWLDAGLPGWRNLPWAGQVGTA